MTASMHLVGDDGGNVVVTVHITSPDDVATVEAVEGGLVAVELAADEPARIRLIGPASVLARALWAAVGELERLQ